MSALRLSFDDGGTVTSLDATPYALPFSSPYVTSRGTLYRREAILVRVRTSEGLVGLGEAVPLSLRGGDPIAQVHTELLRIAPWLEEGQGHPQASGTGPAGAGHGLARPRGKGGGHTRLEAARGRGGSAGALQRDDSGRASARGCRARPGVGGGGLCDVQAEGGRARGRRSGFDGSRSAGQRSAY